MKIFRAKGDGEFDIIGGEGRGDSQTATSSPELVKLKISTITPTSADIATYQGKINRNYPIVPCHMATAVVSEDRPEYDLKRGAKVILNPYISSSTEGEGSKNAKVYGIDVDGFLRDFIAMPIDNIIAFPEEVKENEAVFTELVAVALAAINTFKINKGEYIAIVGGSVLSNIMAQLALYYQAIPILISSDARYLKIAEKCGIYYTIDESQEDTYQRVLNITGGRMAEHTILHAKGGVSPSFLFNLAGRGGDCLIVSLNSFQPRMEADISLVCKKQLTVKGVSSGIAEINAAVNMLAQKQLDFSHFIDKTVELDEAGELFDELSDNLERYICPVIKV